LPEVEEKMEKRPTNNHKKSNKTNLIQGLIFGILFGFLLQKGGATKYDIIAGQLLLTDFTVVKIMLSAVVTGMIGIYAMKAMGWVKLDIKPGGWSINVIGGMIFGAGFALLGYCPGTIAGAIGNGYLDAAIGGLIGIWLGTALFAELYPRLDRGILKKGYFGSTTLPQLFKVNDWLVVLPVSALIALLLWWMERAGL